jgi:dienelactone hydrolase
MPITGEWAFGPWPDGLPVQIHGMDKDPFFALGGDLDAARELVATVGSELAELFVYPGGRHLFTDSSLPSYDADAAALAVQRSRAFLDRLG